MSAKSDHRIGIWDRWRNDEGIVRCFADPTARTCRGRLEAAHWISAARLREERRKLALTTYRFHPDDPRHALITVSLDDLIADDRNGVPLCSHAHHPAFDGRNGKRLVLTPPACVIEFAETYGLGYLIDTPTEERAA